jgi:hypothetical protein
MAQQIPPWAANFGRFPVCLWQLGAASLQRCSRRLAWWCVPLTPGGSRLLGHPYRYCTWSVGKDPSTSGGVESAHSLRPTDGRRDPPLFSFASAFDSFGVPHDEGVTAPRSRTPVQHPHPPQTFWFIFKVFALIMVQWRDFLWNLPNFSPSLRAYLGCFSKFRFFF